MPCGQCGRVATTASNKRMVLAAKDGHKVYPWVDIVTEEGTAFVRICDTPLDMVYLPLHEAAALRDWLLEQLPTPEDPAK